MPPVEINYLAVVAAAVLSMVIGFLWYGPNLFGKQWMKLMGYTKESMEKAKEGMGKTYAISFFGALVMAYVLSHIIDYAQATSMVSGMQAGFWSWLGFVAPVQMTEALFGNKKWNLYYINTGYQLASLLVMGAVLAVWV